ncbi:PRTRC system protein B [Taibaiella chishuiensis]|uniref:PRTRC genetic system protein B n=1 Tax=Taibaiella chishuiensis TaxID=1434707 RepID=A0A2P8D0U9_9BACT|nr:PRTRC system protein B [Taibaiella chishuiensis]PSK90853.1 PRTRC genetic system protein B [Taibaiella chishuiensis]
MNNITREFEQIFAPYKALLIYKTLKQDNETYVEAYDVDQNGFPINAHPLSIQESVSLAQSLASSKELKNNYLQCKGLLPGNLIYLDLDFSGYAVWFTPPQKVQLYFKDHLGIPCGQAHIPSLIWKADKKAVSVFAHKGQERPSLNNVLYVAPFFNVDSNGNVCMGNVDVDFSQGYFLEDFIRKWESNFFGSYFSHTLGGHSLAKGNIVQLWQRLMGSGKTFPESQLVKTKLTLKSLLK